MDLGFGTWKVRSMYRAGSLSTVAEVVSKYKGVQEVRWVGGGTKPASQYTFSMGREIRITNWVQVFFVHKRIMSAVKRVEFVSDRISYIILRGRWCDIIVLNVHAPTEAKTDYIKNRFYDEQVFDKFP
jgi:hypothetical protein